jgi:maleate isomerase
MEPDAWAARWRIGLLVPHADVGPESEFQAMAPPEVAVHATRVPFGAMAPGGAMDPTIPLAPVRAFAEPPHVDQGVELLAAAPLHTIAFAFTSSAYVIGIDGEQAMIERLTALSRGIPVVATGAATVAALRRLDAQRIAVFDPPWFDLELSDLGRQYYQAAGFDVMRASPCELPSDQFQITPEALFEQVRADTPAEAQAVVVGGNGFRAVGVIDALEGELGRPVLTANSALLWAALAAAGATTTVTRYGRIFSLPSRRS